MYYENKNHQNKTIKLREQALETLQENKKIRKKLGGENTHIQQCSNIPDIFTDELVYHSECYQKFPYAKKLVKKIKQFLDRQKELD